MWWGSEWAGLYLTNPLEHSRLPKTLDNLLLLSLSVMCNSLWPHGLQHARPPSPSPSPRACPSSCPLHWWHHPAISSSDALFSFCPQSFPASGTFPVSQLFTSDGQNPGVSALASVLDNSLCSILGKFWDFNFIWFFTTFRCRFQLTKQANC